MIKTSAICLLALQGVMWGQAPSKGWTAGICNDAPLYHAHWAAPECPNGQKVEFRGNKKDCIFRCVAPDPIDVPAVKKQRKVCQTYLEWLSAESGTACEKWGMEDYWDCNDHSRALIVSMDGKKAVCHKLD